MQTEGLTLKEIQAAESARLSRAWKLGKLREEVEKTSSRFESLQAQLAAPQGDRETLEGILGLAQKMPRDLVVRGNALLADGGQNLRDFLLREVGFALGQMADARKKLEAELPVARQRSRDAVTRLAEFEFANN